MDHADIRGLATAFHLSVAGLPQSSVGDHPMDAHISCSRIPLIGPRHRVAPPQSWQTGFSCAVGCPRIRHYGLLASAERQRNIVQARQLLAVPAPEPEVENANNAQAGAAPACPCCGGRMVIIETFERGGTPRYHSTVPTRIVRIDTS